MGLFPAAWFEQPNSVLRARLKQDQDTEWQGRSPVTIATRRHSSAWLRITIKSQCDDV